VTPAHAPERSAIHYFNVMVPSAEYAPRACPAIAPPGLTRLTEGRDKLLAQPRHRMIPGPDGILYVLYPPKNQI